VVSRFALTHQSEVSAGQHPRFSPSEFIHFREVFNEPLGKIIGDFVKAGLGSIPGGGGEILVDRVRRKVSPLKAMSDDWLEVMDVAQRLGLNSSATMMFGHVETIKDRIEHLERLRQQQTSRCNVAQASSLCSQYTDQRSVPLLSYRLLHRIHLLDVSGRAHETQGSDGRRARVFADTALGRIYLDNFTNVQSFVGDAGSGNRPGRAQVRRERSRSIMIEENVVSQAARPSA